MNSVWGGHETKFFFSLTPDRVLEAVERVGIRTTGKCLALNSMENRVFDVELEGMEGLKNPADRSRVVKFYRPGRWNREQILEEHGFLRELAAAEVPVVAPLEFPSGGTLETDPESGILYAVFPKRGGRAPDELSDSQLAWIARTLARLHNIGEQSQAEHRLLLGPETYGYANIDYLLGENWIPLDFERRYSEALEGILEISAPWFDEVHPQRIHGDAHLGNFLWRAEEGPLLLDFDDMAMGPVVQDFWLLFSGRDEATKRSWEIFLDAYLTLRDFDRSTLRLVEPLRALRFVHFSAWIARRWEDPSFQAAFPRFNSHEYWREQTEDMEEQLSLVQLAETRPYFDTF